MKNTIAYLVVTLSVIWSLSVTAGDEYSIVINNGRVIDPETGLDGIRHLGLHDGTITTISTVPLTGSTEIDASGLVVAPGFIDLHTHSPTELGQYYQAFDGVTTALELEAGAFPVSSYGKQISNKPLLNYGASAGYIGSRLKVMNGLVVRDMSMGEQPSVEGWRGWMTAAKYFLFGMESAIERTRTVNASDNDLLSLRESMEQELDNGSLGIGLALDYISEAVDTREMRMIFQLSGERQAPLFVHIRRGINGDPSGLREVLALAEEFNTPLHICHITHNAISNLDLFLSEIREARSQGVNVTTEVLPYNAGSTSISAAVFNRDWQTIFGITYDDVEWAATGERFTQKTWEERKANEPNGLVIHHYLKEEWTRQAIKEPGVIIVSDLVPMVKKEDHVPPHNGAFTKMLRYSRDYNLLELPQILEKMSLLPAQRLENYAPAFARKGRIQPDKDADLVIFNPNTIEDKATYGNPYQEAAGLVHVIVGGQPIIRNGELVPDVYPGKRILAHH